MIHKVYTVYDDKSGAYMLPFYSVSRGAAIRSFTEAVNSSGHDFNKYPGDFTLFELGEYDDATAKFVFLDSYCNLGVAIEFLKA